MYSRKTFNLPLTGGVTYDSVKSPPAGVEPAGEKVPSLYRRLNFWLESGAMNVKTGSGPVQVYPAGSAYDTGPTQEPMGEDVKVNGTGILYVEYWT